MRFFETTRRDVLSNTVVGSVDRRISDESDDATVDSVLDAKALHMLRNGFRIFWGAGRESFKAVHDDYQSTYYFTVTEL